MLRWTHMPRDSASSIMAEKRRRRLVMSSWRRCRTFGASIQSADRTVVEVSTRTFNKVEK
jgi:transcriptional regulator of acetoin/glycerol metabolism